MFKKLFKKSAAPEDSEVSEELKRLRAEIKNSQYDRYSYDALILAIVADGFVTGGLASVLTFAGTYIGVIGHNEVDLRRTKTWKNAAGQKITGKGYMKRALKGVEKHLNKQIRKQDSTDDLSKKKIIRSQISTLLAKYKPLSDQVKIVYKITDQENEPYYFHIKHKDGTVEKLPFTKDPFDQILTHMDKLKKNPNKGFGI